jgi:ABC-type uncharacterized transport system involved in gliding motility auxiliary subunit
MERKARARTESLAFLAIVVLALGLVNVLAMKYFARWDLTKRQLYTLSEGTRRIVGGLRDQLTITVYFTPNQPPPANDDERFLRDQLDEYRALGRGRVNVRFVTPDNEQRRHDAENAGCVKAPLQAVNAREEQATIQEVYRCVTFEYLGRRDKIEFLPPGVQGLEYEISSIIKNLSLPENQRERTIGFLTGHGELTPDEGMQYLSQIMEQERVNYRTRTINLNGGDSEVPQDIKGLIIANPQRRLEERELRRLDQYLMRGGSIAIFAGGVYFALTDPTSASGSAAEHHLNDWLSNYGITINTDVVLDPRSTDGVVRVGRQAGRVRLVTWPVIAAMSGTPSANDLETQGGLDPSFPATFRLPQFIAPYPSSIGINRGTRNRVGGDLTIFGRTGPRSIARTSDFDLNIIEILQQGRQLFENLSNHGPYTVAVALQGRFASAYAGSNAVTGGDAGVAGDGGAAASNIVAPARAERSARLMVVSSGSVFALDTLRIMAQLSGGQRPDNLTLLFNTFDWLSQDTDLLAVRAKDTSEPQLRADISDTAKSVFKWGTIVVLPLAIGVLGVALMSARRSRRKNYAKELGIATEPGANA